MTTAPQGPTRGRQPASDVATAAFRDRSRVTNLARTELVAQALEDLRDGVLSAQGRLAGQRAAHSVAGSAGTFSFRAASELGRVLEEHPSDTGDVDHGDDAQVRAMRSLDLVNQLRQALAQPADAASPPDRGGQHR